LGTGTFLEDPSRVRFSWEDLAEIFFPPTCLACAEVLPAASPFCEDCAAHVERLPWPHCIQCSEPGAFLDRRCPRCALRPPAFSRAFAPFAHDGPIARAIHQFKYEDHPELAPGLAKLMADEAGHFLSTSPGIICAIPLHRKRFRERKYDHAQLLAAALAKRTGQRVVHALSRWRPTDRQVGLSEADREINVAGAFRPTCKLRGEQVLLVDDVFTTGATARSAARALLQGGAKSVRVLTLARAFSMS
jgi:ComF family protein